jgi:uncharacterized protein
MTRDEALATLRRHEAELRRQGVARAAIFGSVARGEAGPDSDLDVLVEIDPQARVGVWEYAGIIRFIADLFPVRVDVAERDALKPFVRPCAEREAVYAF